MAPDARQTAPARDKPPPGHARRWPSLLWRVGRWPVVFYLLVILLMMLLENRLVFIPSRYPAGRWHLQGPDVEDAWFESGDGLRLHGWYLPHPEPRAVILFCHGNAGNVTNRIETLRKLHRRAGASVLVFDYRGYGRSEGSPDEAGVLADARAARAWLARREGISEQDIVLLGRSLGGAVAVDLAAADGAKALILESTFSSAPDLAAHHYPWLPVRTLMQTRLDSAAKIARYRGPLLASHGDADRTVPIALGRRVFEAAKEPKQFLVIPGGDHNDPLTSAYLDKLAEFLTPRRRPNHGH